MALAVVSLLLVTVMGLAEARPFSLRAWQDGQQSQGAISVTVELVVLHATVRDRKGRVVSGLQKQQFRVYEDGELQTIERFQEQDIPVAVGLVVDDSGSMQPKRPEVAAAALAFVNASNSDDELFVVNFNENVSFGLPPGKLFSANPSELDRAILDAPHVGMTALYDAIDAAFSRVRQANRDKKVLIVISDGGDNASGHTLKQVLQHAERSDVIIYSIGLFDQDDGDDSDRNPRVLKQIARVTGGEAFFPEQTSKIVGICKRISEDIRNQYTIGYAPTNEKLDGTYRTIKVTAVGRNGEKLVVRTRAGYIASPMRD
jgi:Ca-activated chloride channel homolog